MINTGTWGDTLEAHVYAELVKEAKDMVPKPSIYYWRTNNGAEVDFIIEKDKVPFSIVLYRGEEVVYLNESTLAVPIGILY